MQLETGTEVLDTLRAHVRATFLVGRDEAALDPDAELLASGIVDSMGVMELIAFIEESFGVVVDDQEVIPDNFVSLRAMARLVAKKQGTPLEDLDATLADEVRSLIAESVPRDAVVLVASHGDEALLDLEERSGWHFPREDSGAYRGYDKPADGAEAISHLEALRSLGATHIAFPTSELWWLDHYTELRDHLEVRYGKLTENETGVVYSLQPET